MCDLCVEANRIGHPAEVANRLLEQLTDAFIAFKHEGVDREYPQIWEKFDRALSDLDFLCMEHLSGKLDVKEGE